MPQRPNMPDCHAFVKNGCCRFLQNCRYHHPYERLGGPILDDRAQRAMSTSSSQQEGNNSSVAMGAGGSGSGGGGGSNDIVNPHERAPCDVFLNV
ncbi:unnamed protein product, partial [Hapterophycus canaliculatus]